MRVIICGGRHYHLTPADIAWLDTLDITHVREGGARGADTCAGDWAQSRGIVVQPYPADWKTYGRAAGPVRNTTMVQALLGDQVWGPIAVIAFSGGRGTQDLVTRAQAAGIPVMHRDAPPHQHNEETSWTPLIP